MTDTDQFIDDTSGALFSDDREHRYRLWRTWDVKKPTLAFIMLNPSTADEVTLDPTCRRCKGYAEDWGYGTLVVGNIFALRSKKPENLYDHPDPVGNPENDEHLQEIVADADKVIAAWGDHGVLQDRGQDVAEMLEGDLYALNTTKDGQPNHPLYQPADADPEPYTGPGGDS